MMGGPKLTPEGSEPLGRRERRKQQTRRALLDAALELFAERGLESTRLEDITERADLGKGAFYNYFESKDALIAELLSEGVKRVSTHLEGIDREGTFKERVAFVANQHQQFFDEHPEQFVLFHEARGLLTQQTKGGGRLAHAFATYLIMIGAALWGPEGSMAAAVELEERRIDGATAFVGALSGYRSFRMAVGAPVNSQTIIDMLAAGLPDDEAMRIPPPETK